MGRCLSCSQENCHHQKFCECDCHDDDDVEACSGCERPTQFCRCSPNVAANTGTYKIKRKAARLWYQSKTKANPTMNAPKPEPKHVFYAVRNAEGKYYKTYSSSGSGRGWVTELATAKIWSKESMARATVTRLANEKPKAPIPSLVEFHVAETRVIDQVERVAESRAKKVIEEQERKKREAEYHLEQARRRLEEAQRSYADLARRSPVKF